MKEKVRARLTAIATQNNGHLTPDLVLTDAQNPESPLHGEYDWDVEKAARQHWLDRSRELIRSYEVIIHTTTTSFSVVGYVADPDTPAKKQGYVSLQKLKEDDALARRVLADECARILGNLTRARKLSVALQLEEAFDDLLQRLAGVRSIVEKPLPLSTDTSANHQVV